MVFGDLGLGPARGIGADDVLDASTLEDTCLLDPRFAVDAAMSGLEDRQNRPRQGVPPRVVGIRRINGRAGRIGTRQLLEPEHQARDAFEMSHLAEILITVIGDDGPFLGRRGGIPEETLRGALLDKDAITMQTAELFAEIGHPPDHLFHVRAEADRGVLHEHLRDAHFDGVQFGLTFLPKQEAFGPVLIAREPTQHRERVAGRDVGIGVEITEFGTLQREA